MPLKVVQDDLFSINADALVNPTDYNLSGSGSIDGFFHKLGGEELEAELKSKGHTCFFGQVVVSKAYHLTAKYIFHTCAELYTGKENESEKGRKKNRIENCYLNCLKEATKLGISSIAFPLIGTGSFRNPLDQSMLTAINVINDYLFDHNLLVYLVLYSDKAYQTALKFFPEESVDVNPELVYVAEHSYSWNAEEAIAYYKERNIQIISKLGGVSKEKEKAIEPFQYELKGLSSFGDEVKKILKDKYITQRNLAFDAMLDTAHLSRILSGEKVPEKYNVMKIIFALKMNLADALHLMAKLGYTLSDNIYEDRVYKYCLENSIYDFKKIDEMLSKHSQIRLYKEI